MGSLRTAGRSRPSGRIFGGDCLTAPSTDGQLIVLHVRSSTYLRLDRSAARIFRLLETEGDPQRAAVALSRQFDVPRARAAADVDHVVASVRHLTAPKASSGRRPTPGGLAQVVAGWWRLPVRLRWEAAKASLVAVVAEIGLHTMDLPTLCHLMGVPLVPGLNDDPPPRTQSLDPFGPAERRSLWAATWVLERWTHDPTCLRQALILGFLLRHRHPHLRLGLIGDGSVAHAWVEGEDFVYNTEPVRNSFLASTA
jgi:Coenzyme PQQ synthesis protein D (PqqD)/Transglutaminase-like superfamily